MSASVPRNAPHPSLADNRRSPGGATPSVKLAKVQILRRYSHQHVPVVGSHHLGKTDVKQEDNNENSFARETVALQHER